MSIAPYLREIGRGADGARALPREQAYDLMSQLLDGRLSDLEIGAFAIAMRMKGETLAELQGFTQALHERLAPLPGDVPVIAIASYNGARRLPNLVPLLALRLARAGARVLVHGPLRDPNRVTTAEVFEALGVPPAASLDAVPQLWRDTGCAFVPTPLLCAALDRLLAVRRTVGLRNSGHTIAKLMQPVQGARCLRLLSHTHPEFGRLMADFAAAERADMALLRGTEGEAVADPRRLPRLRIWIDGQPRPELGCEPEAGTVPAAPQLPPLDAAATARWIAGVLGGMEPIPAPIEHQARLLLQAHARLNPARSGPA